MSEYMHDITPEMVQNADKLRASNFEGATAEEIELYTEFNTLLRLHSEEVREKARLRDEESAQRKAAFQAQAQSAMNALETLNAVAQAKLAAVESVE